NGQRTEYLIDPTGLGNVVGEYGAGEDERYVHGLGLIGMVGVVGPCEYEFDGQGNVVGMTAPDGSISNRYVYAPFGERLFAEEPVANPFQFMGRFGVIHDGNSLNFMRARFYADAEGRYVSEDPIGFVGSDANLFRYVFNDPVNLIDPLGHQARPTSPP